MGCKVIDILTHSDMVDLGLINSDTSKHPVQALHVKDKNLMSTKTKQRVINLPTKLPMICPPKEYGSNKLGGYLLNDEKFADNLFVEKKAYALTSELSDNNKIYEMVNKLARTPFKINQTLLDYIAGEGSKHNLLIDVYTEHKFANLEKRSKYQQSVFASHNSKVVLQETILGLAEFYRKFSKIYFPLRLDQRGRLYCSPDYLNYQSSELAKSLLLFAEAGTIHKDNVASINYLKFYGVNCFGGVISKASINSKIEWVDKNLNNILNYDNSILLKDAKEKLMFLAFCMEYKRFYEFYRNENTIEFKTYLPVQLDATCNGFQHMALLSNEETLFKELNLVSELKKKKKGQKQIIDSQPGDFYSFLLHKLINLFKDKLAKGQVFDNNNKVNDDDDDYEDDDEYNEGKGKGSYKRLALFNWGRTHIKKAVMTIPYNSSNKSMKDYITENLVRVDCDEDDLNWWSISEDDSTNRLNDKDIYLLVKSIKDIIKKWFWKD